VVIVTLALIVFAFDAHSQVLIEATKQTGHPMLFYYTMGLVLSLSVLGMWFSVVQMGCCGDGRDGRGCSGCGQCGGPHPGDCYCGDMYFFPCVYSSPHTTVIGAGDCCCAQTECCVCCGPGAADGVGAAGAGCGECGGAAAGEECLMFLLVAVVVFAVVGAVVCVVVGLAYAQKVVRSHWHVLQKYTLAEDYVVADLGEGALPPARHNDGERGASVDLEAGGGGLLSTTMGIGSSYRRLGTQEPGEEDVYLNGPNGQVSGLIEMRPTGYSAGGVRTPLPSAPPASAMDRDSVVAGTDPYTGATAPYDPHFHHFPRAHYQELASRGLI
jgi:hypothetical protein